MLIKHTQRAQCWQRFAQKTVYCHRNVNWSEIESSRVSYVPLPNILFTYDFTLCSIYLNVHTMSHTCTLFTFKCHFLFSSILFGHFTMMTRVVKAHHLISANHYIQYTISTKPTHCTLNVDPCHYTAQNIRCVYSVQRALNFFVLSFLVCTIHITHFVCVHECECVSVNEIVCSPISLYESFHYKLRTFVCSGLMVW